MIRGNGTGPMEVRVNREQDFAIFDSLPAEVRRSLNEAWFNRSAAGVKPQLATIGAERAAALLGPGGACDVHAIKAEERTKREAAERAAMLELLGVRTTSPAWGARHERVY